MIIEDYGYCADGTQERGHGSGVYGPRVGGRHQPGGCARLSAGRRDEENPLEAVHAKAGADMLSKNMNQMVSPDFLKVACDMAQYHHEKWNGKGYPEGLAGKDIPLSARILAVTDVFDALVSKRQYKEGMSIDQAFAIMEKDRGESFEPEILDIFFETRGELERLLVE